VSDVVAVGLITAGASVATAIIGGVVTARVNRRTADAAVRTAHQQGEIELAKIESQHREERRQHRYDAYHRLINTMNRMDSYGTGSIPPGENFERQHEQVATDLSAVLLLGTDDVIKAVGSLQDVFGRIQTDAEQQGGPTERVTLDNWQSVYGPYRDELTGQVFRVLSVMRQDMLTGVDRAY
jgi:hypothetical protein